MTIEERLKQMLIGAGMRDEDAEKVMLTAKPELEKLPIFAGIIANKTWNGLAKGYPEMVFNSLWYRLKEIALEWVQQNKPETWYRPIFENLD
ncbi:hypothetical protein ACFL0Z_03465 [Patescibacteria group bacterium]